MGSQLTVRIPDELETQIAGLAKGMRLKRSDIVRLALERFVAESQGQDEITPYEKVRKLVGGISSSIPDLGESHRKHIMKKLKQRA
jgi:Arc/MetJ-type ribon-helix-helix transcriptional regulator